MSVSSVATPLALQRWQKNQADLLNFLAQEQQKTCQRILGKARQEAALRIAEARHQAQAQLHTEIVALRQQLADFDRQQAANLWQARQQADFQQQQALLTWARLALTNYLQARWQRGQRADWLKSLRQQAEKLPKTPPWQVATASLLSDEEQALWPADTVFTVRPSLAAGAEVQAGAVHLDASLQALVNDSALMARLLSQAQVLENLLAELSEQTADGRS